MKFSRILSQGIILLTVFACSNSAHTYQAPTYYNNDATPPPPNCYGLNFDLKASYLYWNVQEQYLTFGVTNIGLTTPTTGNSTLKTHDRKWDSGFRLEASLANDCNPIGCHFEWTYFKTTSNASAANSNIGVTSAIGPIPFTDPFLAATNTNSKWKININEFAFDIDYRLPYNQCISFSPYLGVFGAIINQKQNIFNYNATNGFGVSGNVFVFRKNDFWGIGPRFGFAANWNLTQQFSLIFDANFAYLLGKINTKNNYQVLNIPSALASLDSKIWCLRPMGSAFVGLNWEGCVSDCSTFSLSLGYEFQYWWHQWHSTSNLIDDLLSGEGRWGNLSLNGLVASIGISF